MLNNYIPSHSLQDTPPINSTADTTPTKSASNTILAHQESNTPPNYASNNAANTTINVEKIQPHRALLNEPTISIAFSKSLQSSIALKKAAKRCRVFMICIKEQSLSEEKYEEEPSPLDYDENGVLKKDYINFKLNNQILDVDEIIEIIIKQFNASNADFQLAPKVSLFQLVNVEIEDGVPDVGVKLELEDIPNCKYMGLCLANGVKSKDAVLKNSKDQQHLGTTIALSCTEDKIPIKVIHEQDVYIVDINRASNMKQLFQAFVTKKNLLLSEADYSGFSIKGSSLCFGWDTRVVEIPQESTVELRKKSPQHNVKLFKTAKVPEPEDFVFTKETASAYREYSVIKQNRLGRRQARRMGIDADRIYNLPARSSSVGRLSVFGSVKRKFRDLSDVVKAELVRAESPRHFVVLFRDLQSNAILSYRYEAENEYESAEIVAKIEYLRLRVVTQQDEYELCEGERVAGHVAQYSLLATYSSSSSSSGISDVEIHTSRLPHVQYTDTLNIALLHKDKAHISHITVIPANQLPTQGYCTSTNTILGHKLAYTKTYNYKPKDIVDCKDSIQKWCVAEILKIEAAAAYVHYVGWSDKWNEWIPINSDRIAPLRTYTIGDTGATLHSTAAAFDLLTEEFQVVLQVTDKLEHIVLQTNLSKDTFDFVTTKVSSALEKTLTSSISDKSMIPVCLKFLHLNIRVFLLVIGDTQLSYSELVFENMLKIFNFNSFGRRLYYSIGNVLEESEIDGDFAKKTGERVNVEIVLAGLINVFGNFNGFDLIIQRFQDSIKPFSLKEIRYVVNFLLCIKDVVDDQFSHDFFPKFYALILKRMNKISEEELKILEKDDIEGLIKDIETIFETFPDFTSQIEDVEYFKLNLGYMFLTCPFLAKRVLGISLIVEIVELLDHERNFSSYYRSSKRSASLKFLSNERFISWAKEKKLYSILFGPTTHQELIKRCLPVLKLSAVHESLSNEVLKLIWDSSVGKHEVIVRAVYDLLSELVKELNSEQLHFLFNLLRNLDLSSLSDYTFEFIENVYLNSISNLQKDEGFRDFSLFWDIIQDDSNASSHLFNRAYNALLKLMTSERFATTRKLFIEKCYENISKKRSIPQSLQMLKDLIQLFPYKSYLQEEHCSQSALIEDLRVNRNFLEIFSSELVSYRNSLIASENSQNLLKRFNHAENMMKRLEFYEFFMLNSSVQIEPESIDLLLDIFVVNPVTTNDKVHFIKWIRNIIDIDSFERSIISERAVKYFFDCFSVENDQTTMFKFVLESIDAFECFEIYFRYLNGQLKSIAHPFQNIYAKVREFESLTGVSILWKIVICTRCEVVFRKGCDLLVFVHSKLDYNLDCKKIGSEFVARCFELLESCRSEMNRGDFVRTDVESARNVLNLLLSFLKLDKQHSSKLNDSIPLLISHDKRKIDLLFDLLSYGGKFADEVWKILDILPKTFLLDTIFTTNVAAASSVNESHWDKIFNPSSILKTLYALQIIDDRLNSWGCSTFDKMELMKWKQHFSETGGIRCLLCVLNELDLEPLFSQTLTRKAVLLIVKLVFILLKDCENLANQFELSHIKLENIMLRIMDVLSLSFKMPPDSLSVSARLDCIDVHNKENAAESEEDSYCTSYILGLLNMILSVKPTLFEDFYSNSEKIDQVIHSGFFYNHDSKSRVQLAQGIWDICLKGLEFFQAQRKSENPIKFFLMHLLAFLEGIETRSEYCLEYFKILTHLLENHESNPQEEEFRNQFVQVVQQIKNIQMISTSGDLESVLEGLLQVGTCFLKLYPSMRELIGCSNEYAMVKEVFNNCLFKLPSSCSSDRPKCLSESSRFAAYMFLIELAEGSESCMKELFSCIQLLHSDLTSESGAWDLADLKMYLSSIHPPSSFKRESRQVENSSIPFKGLRNPGCICYLNSLLQQLFMIPSLKQKILDVKCSSEDKVEDFMYQLQYLFGCLQKSQRPYCDPLRFCHAFKEYDGTPTDVSVQKDSNEFLNLLFDRIDTLLKGSKWEKILQEDLGGCFANQLICKDCPHVSERDEPFYCITLNVKDKKNIIESLDSFIEGEVLEGENAYLCSKCNAKIDTVKRVVIKTLPSTLILHLKRFELNFDNMEMVKLNDRCEFPLMLNMQAYTKEGLAARGKGVIDLKSKNGKVDIEAKDSELIDVMEKLQLNSPEYYEYELSGVLVHTGSAHGGHYYSFVKERVDKSENANPRWISFNDSSVDIFDPRLIPDECFGGEETVTHRNHYFNSSEYKTERRRNAYLLFYDRVDRKWDSKLEIPAEILEDVCHDNVKYWRDRYLKESAYCDFISRLSEAC